MNDESLCPMLVSSFIGGLYVTNWGYPDMKGWRRKMGGALLGGLGFGFKFTFVEDDE